jgi:hypothetical protein
MSQNKKLKVAMQLVLAVSTTGAASILYNAPVGAVDYAAPDYVKANADGGVVGPDGKAIVGTASAKILTQITEARITELNFGKVVPSATAGTITVDSSGNVTNEGGARYIPGTNATNATLSFSGEASQNIIIAAPSTVDITHSSISTEKMTVTLSYGDGFNTAGNTATAHKSIKADGKYELNYGGTLAVGAGQASGTYAGTYDIYVTYEA